MRFDVAIVTAILSASLGAVAATSCADLSGTFSSTGIVEFDGKSASITFLQALSRPSINGVESIRLEVRDSLIVHFLAADGSNIGGELKLAGACLDGRWVRSSSYDGSGDGTRVKGTRKWKYSRAADGSLLIEFTEAGDTYYLPGIPISGSASGVSRFEQRTR